MNKEWAIYIFQTILMIYLLSRFVPRDKIREAHLTYLFTQFITWSIGLFVAEFNLIEYPARALPHADQANFIFEFFLFPSICTLFVVHYPENKSAFAKFMYYFYYCTSLTIIEVIQEKYTNILVYIHWSWYVTWITFFITFYAAVKYKHWYFKQ